ncbi:restriction endonuclease [Afipia massiliensis]|uniref:Restriction endonuclease n=1 Tax=Afipia massiliensis TaxID=211460 RepID=A0A4U6BT39_9BRAD|nr:restriction endonuclease [Afipia massiliensis]
MKAAAIGPGAFVAIPKPAPWPNANARLLGIGAGLPVSSLDRLATFSPNDFERFILEWADGYLAKLPIGVADVQQRGGAGDKGRDIVVWLDPSNIQPRRWHLYQCKRYAGRLGSGVAAAEIAKVLYYTERGDYTPPESYWFVTHKGVTGDLQDLLDDPSKLRSFILANWSKHCATKITTDPVALSPELTAHINAFDFSIFKAKQPLQLINEHAQTSYHLAVFGLPLIDRPAPPAPPSTVAPEETRYVTQLYAVIAEKLGVNVASIADFAQSPAMQKLFDRSRITFYSAEGLKELARDQMADATFFDTLLGHFRDGLFHAYTTSGQAGLVRLQSTVLASQSLQLGGHVLDLHATPNDREGVCHHLANDGSIEWCEK